MSDSTDSHEELKEAFQFVIDNSTDGYFEWGLRGGASYEYYSPHFKKILGYKDEEFLDVPESWQNTIFPEDRKIVLENLEKHKKDPGYPFYQEVRYRHKQGHTVWLICRGIIIRNRKGKPVKLIGTHTDITNYKKIEKKLSNKIMLLEGENDKNQLVVSEISHNINNILSGLIGTTSLLRYISTEKEKSDFLDDINVNLNLLSNMLNELLDSSRSGFYRKDTPVKVKLKNEIIPILKPFRVRAQNKNLTLTWKFSKNIPKHIYMKITCFTQILINLVDNAVKYTEQGSVHIIIDYIKSENELKLIVKDTGIGIKRENRKKIFQLMYRETPKYCQGSGIGLYNCKELCDFSDGKIWFKSRKTGGTTFYVKFPTGKSK